MSCFFFKQKTAYEVRISDWSSDVCSSDLADRRRDPARHFGRGVVEGAIVYQPARPPDLRHHAVAGVDAQRAGDTADLRSFADVDAGRADRDALVAIDAVAEGVGILLGLLDAAARLAAPALVVHETRFFVPHRGDRKSAV